MTLYESQARQAMFEHPLCTLLWPMSVPNITGRDTSEKHIPHVRLFLMAQRQTV